MPVTDEPHSARGNEREQRDGWRETERERGGEKGEGGGGTQERKVVLRRAEDIWMAMRSAGVGDFIFMPSCGGGCGKGMGVASASARILSCKLPQSEFD